MNLTDNQREALLDRAVTAIRDHFRTALLADDRAEVTDAEELAELAVTDAVTRGNIPHSHIAKQAGCSTLHVAELITDLDAAGRALGHERKAARDYTDNVRRAIRDHAAKVAATKDRGTVTRAAEHLDATRKAVYDWAVAPDADETAAARQQLHQALMVLARPSVSTTINSHLQQGLRSDVTVDAMARRVKAGIDHLEPGEVTTEEMNLLTRAYTRALNLLDEPKTVESLRRLKDVIRRHHGAPEGES